MRSMQPSGHSARIRRQSPCRMRFSGGAADIGLSHFDVFFKGVFLEKSRERRVLRYDVPAPRIQLLQGHSLLEKRGMFVRVSSIGLCSEKGRASSHYGAEPTTHGWR